MDYMDLAVCCSRKAIKLSHPLTHPLTRYTISCEINSPYSLSVVIRHACVFVYVYILCICTNIDLNDTSTIIAWYRDAKMFRLNSLYFTWQSYCGFICLTYSIACHLIVIHWLITSYKCMCKTLSTNSSKSCVTFLMFNFMSALYDHSFSQFPTCLLKKITAHPIRNVTNLFPFLVKSYFPLSI